MKQVTLKISISPRDYQLLNTLLPHQLNTWAAQVHEILIVIDTQGFELTSCNETLNLVNTIVNQSASWKNKTKIIEVDNSKTAHDQISKSFFNGKRVPHKTHRLGPYYAYFYGLYHAKFNYILNLDCDIFFGGSDPNWINEAINLLDSNEEIITCSPFPGPPTSTGELLGQIGQTDTSSLRKVLFDSISTRIFFIYRPDFIERLCPIPIKYAEWSLLYRAILRRRPIYELPEDTITDIMKFKHLKRADFLGTGQGIWTLHPPFRNESFYTNLPNLVKQIESGNIPEEQRGYYDINDSMINWNDARELIKNASIKEKLLKLISFK